MAVAANTPIELVNGVYERLSERVAIGRTRLGRSLTFAEKVLVNHLRDPETGGLERGRSYTDLDPDRVAMQDATAQMALLQFMTAGLPEVAVPSTVHCDHLIQAKSEGRIDLATAVDVNAEVYDFLESVPIIIPPGKAYCSSTTWWMMPLPGFQKPMPYLAETLDRKS